MISMFYGCIVGRGGSELGNVSPAIELKNDSE
jgi:hypothetical protein